MTGLIEQVARAIARTEFADYVDNPSRWDEVAMIAIEAMRDPTPAMVAAGERETTPAGCWSAMIDRLLEETE